MTKKRTHFSACISQPWALVFLQKLLAVFLTTWHYLHLINLNTNNNEEEENGGKDDDDDNNNNEEEEEDKEEVEEEDNDDNKEEKEMEDNEDNNEEEEMEDNDDNKKEVEERRWELVSLSAKKWRNLYFSNTVKCISPEASSSIYGYMKFGFVVFLKHDQ